MKFCQDYSKQKVHAAFFICDSGYRYLRMPFYGVYKLNLINTSSVCTKNECHDFTELWKFLNQKRLKKF